VNITLDTYSHVRPGLQAAAAEALDVLLAEPGAEAVSAIREQFAGSPPTDGPFGGDFVRELWWAVLGSNQ
jgi:hypothetical protein